ncbi:MAG: xanthine dehydrogenase family protein molybdopterin-binding subunit [Planctomycetota bacterium]
MSGVENLSRRGFLKGSLLAGGGLILGVSWGARRAQAQDAEPEAPAVFQPNAFLRIAPSGEITLLAKHDEMGQGIWTGLAIVVAEGLRVDPATIRVLPAPADPAFANNAFGVQATGGSTSTWSSYEQMRMAGATARVALVTAAATQWGVDAADCEATDGKVRHAASDRVLGYGELAQAAGDVQIAERVELRERAQFERIGKPTPRQDSAVKVRGQALFSLDQRVEGMLTALVARPPTFGGKLARFDAAEAKAIPGVKAVVEVPSGVAVIGDGYWSAFRGRAALELEWTPGEGGDAPLDSDALRAHFEGLSQRPGNVARDDGDVVAALSAAERTLEAVYEVPYQAHAPMEPLSCLVELRADGGAKLTTGTQFLGIDHPAVVGRLGVTPEQVEFQNSYLGGGFGRRANPASDFVLEALEVALAAKDLGAPIKTVWTREDDLQGGWYRPLFVNRIVAGIQDGAISAWHQRIVGQSIARGTAFEGAMIKDGVDGTSVEGAADMPHGIPNLKVELHSPVLRVPVQWWRSVGHSNTAFAKESMLDELAEALGQDPYALRMQLLEEHPRLQRVLRVAAEAAGWDTEPAEGMGRGISVHESFKGFAAHVVEATLEDGVPRIRRVVVAIDCGLVINPDQVEAQLQGAAIFALSATLGQGITLKDGRVEQSNFHDYPLVRIHEAPAVEVHIVESEEPMGGIGEVGVPGVASAVCSALRAAGAPRIRRLPIGTQLQG